MAIETNQTHTSPQETSRKQSQPTSQTTFTIKEMTCVYVMFRAY